MQVEKAFREGTARQNAHSIFVCLALKLLEERIHVACKEIITLEKQVFNSYNSGAGSSTHEIIMPFPIFRGIFLNL